MKDNQKELFVVVDSDDNIIGHRTRFDCHHDKSLIHRAVSVALFNDKSEILLQKRSKSKDTYPGYLTLSASGHVGIGETYLEAATRETKEELGIEGLHLEYVGRKLVELEQETEMVVVFKAEYNGDFGIAHDEVESVKFYSIDLITQLTNLTPSAREDLKILKII